MSLGAKGTALFLLVWIYCFVQFCDAMPPKTKKLDHVYNIVGGKRYFDGSTAEDPSGDAKLMKDLLNINTRTGATTLCPFGEEDLGKQYNVPLIMASMELYAFFHGIPLKMERDFSALFLKFVCPTCCGGAFVFQFVRGKDIEDNRDERFKIVAFRQGVEHNIDCVHFHPAPKTSLDWEHMSDVFTHCIVIRAVLGGFFNAEHSETLASDVEGLFLKRKYNKVLPLKRGSRSRMKRLLQSRPNYFKADKTGKLDSLDMTSYTNFFHLHATVGKHLYSKRPTAPAPEELITWDIKYQNRMTFESRFCSRGLQICIYCAKHLHQDPMGAPYAHGSHAGIVTRCNKPECEDHPFHPQCFKSMMAMRDMPVLEDFPELYQMYQSNDPHVPNFTPSYDAAEVINHVRPGILFHFNCPYNVKAKVTSVFVVDPNGMTRKKLAGPPQTVVYLDEQHKFPRKPGIIPSEVTGLENTEKYHWNYVFKEWVKRCGFANTIIYTCNSLVSGVEHHLPLVEVRQEDLPAGFPRHFIRPEYTVVDPNNHFEYTGNELDFSETLYCADVIGEGPSFPLEGSENDPITI
jgi:hypothetical protein